MIDVNIQSTVGRRAAQACIAVATLVALWFVWSFTASMSFAARDPRRALDLWPTDAARVGVATQLAASGKREASPQIADLSLAVLARSPVNVAAVRSLALSYLAAGKESAGRTMILAAETLSRRDVPTEMWMIEERVAAGDIPGALDHYDHALRTSIPARDILLPVLAQAANDPNIARDLAPLLRTRPEWWSDFLGRFVDVSTSVRSLRIVSQALRLDPRSEIDRQRIASILARQVALGDLSGATTLYAAATGFTPGRSNGSWIVDGSFEHDSELPPFDWQLSDEADHSAVRNPVEGAVGAVALALVGTDGRDVARQLLVLPAGRYAVKAKVGMVPSGLTEAPALTIACYQAGPLVDPVVSVPLPVTQAARQIATTFTVPANNCGAQFLTISSARSVGYLVDNPWIDNIVITRVGTAGK